MSDTLPITDLPDSLPAAIESDPPAVAAPESSETSQAIPSDEQSAAPEPEPSTLSEATTPAEQPVSAGPELSELTPAIAAPEQPVPAEPEPPLGEPLAVSEDSLLPEPAAPGLQPPASLPVLTLRGKVEALLFASPTPLRIHDLSQFLETPKGPVKKALDELIADLAARDGALTIARQGTSFAVVLKSDYQEVAASLMPPELEPAQLKTLSVIAVHQPLTQSKLVDLRGSTAYEHVKALVEKGYVRKRRDGNTYTLRTTKVFAMRFRVEDDPEKIREAMLALEQRSAELAAITAAADHTADLPTE